MIQTSGSTSPDSSRAGNIIRLDKTMRHNRRREAALQNDTGMWNGLCGLEYCGGQVRSISHGHETDIRNIILLSWGVRSVTVLLFLQDFSLVLAGLLGPVLFRTDVHVSFFILYRTLKSSQRRAVRSVYLFSILVVLVSHTRALPLRETVCKVHMYLLDIFTRLLELET